MATYIKFLAGDYGKEEYIYIKNKALSQQMVDF